MTYLKPRSITRAESLLLAPIATQLGIALLITTDLFSITFIFLVTSIFLAEAHFGATYVFFLHKKNRVWFFTESRRWRMIVAGIIGAILVGMFSIDGALLIAAMISGFHVTRQAVGLRKLLSKDSSTHKLDYVIYLSSGLCLMATGIRFILVPALDSFPSVSGILETILSDRLVYRSLAALLALSVLLVVAFLAPERIDALATIHGALIYVPYLLTDNQLAAHLVAVSGHWLQYLMIQRWAYSSLRWNIPANSPMRPSSSPKAVEVARASSLGAASVVGVLAYAIIMSVIWGLNLLDTGEYAQNSIVLVPVVFHVIHYLIDGQIWRFSDPYLGQNIGRPLRRTVSAK